MQSHFNSGDMRDALLGRGVRLLAKNLYLVNLL